MTRRLNPEIVKHSESVEEKDRVIVQMSPGPIKAKGVTGQMLLDYNEELHVCLEPGKWLNLDQPRSLWTRIKEWWHKQ